MNAPHAPVLLCRPDGYRIAYAINPHMRTPSGGLKEVDPARALRQWEDMAAAYRRLGVPVLVMPGDPRYPDMVFAANQSLPFLAGAGEKAVLLSNMHAPERRGEVRHFEAWFRARGYAIKTLSRAVAGSFEGHGDFLWQPGGRALFGGFGFRTTERALRAASDLVGVPVIPLRLVDERFYHLDTCFMPLGARVALIFRRALDARAVDAVAARFDELVEPPEDEAVAGLACNVDAIGGHHVLIEASCTRTAAMLRERGFEVHALDTSEFLKAGGSVFCMKLGLL